MHLSEDEIALFSAFVLMSAGRCHSQCMEAGGGEAARQTHIHHNKERCLPPVFPLLINILYHWLITFDMSQVNL